MKTLDKLEANDIVYALDKNDLSEIYEFKVIKNEDKYIDIETPYGIYKFLKPNNSVCSTTFSFFDNYHIHVYYIGVSKSKTINGYYKWLKDSEKYYNMIINDLTKELNDHIALLERTQNDIKKINKLIFN